MATLMDVFSPAEDYGIHDRVSSMWTFVEGFPLPKFDMKCICGSTDMKVCAFTYCYKDAIHITQAGGTEYACVVLCRCITCGQNREYSVAVSKDIYMHQTHEGQPIMYHWEKALKIIEGQAIGAR
jgi:hypothetical protein